MGFEESRYRAPEAPIVERPARRDRPFLTFLAGALCLGAAAPLLLAVAAGVVGIGRDVFEDGWHGAFASPYRRSRVAFMAASAVGAAPLVVVGRSFLLVRPGRRAWMVVLAFALWALALSALLS